MFQARQTKTKVTAIRAEKIVVAEARDAADGMIAAAEIKWKFGTFRWRLGY
jgi:hypothetical protein